MKSQVVYSNSRASGQIDTMHSTTSVSKSSQASFDPALDLRVIESIITKRKAESFHRVIVSCEVVADIVTIILAIKLGYLLYGASGFGNHIYLPSRLIWVVGVASAVVMVLLLDRVGAYRRGNSLLRVRETEQIIRVSMEALLAVLAVTFMVPSTIPDSYPTLDCLGEEPYILLLKYTSFAGLR
jgi:hypothetical protein